VNLAHSVSTRLLEISRSRNEDYHFLLVRYGSERLLHRMAHHAVLKEFILKGATLFLVWEGTWFRATRDIDLLGFGSTDITAMEVAFQNLCREDTVLADGLTFDPSSVQADRIKEGQFYEGIRVKLVVHLDRTRIPLQVDIGFGDAVTPTAQTAMFPCLLERSSFPVRAYPPETVIAEKLLAIASLGLLNTRMKDYYDLLVLGRRQKLDSAMCAQAIRNSCLARRLPIPERMPVGLTASFWSDARKISQWKGFVNRNQLVLPVGELPAVVQEVAKYMDPILEQLQ